MPDSTRPFRLLAALSLVLPLFGQAQTAAPLNDADRARRDADKVLDFIKFQTVKTKPATDAADKPRRPVTPAPAPPAPPAPTTVAAPAPPPHQASIAARPAEGNAAPAHTVTPAPVQPAPMAAPTTQAATAARASVPAPTQPAPSLGTPAVAPLPAALPPPAAAATPAEPEAEDDEVELQIQNFVAPVLPPSVQKTLGSGTRKVTVRFTVEADGRVSKADAAADVPVRLVRPATDAVLQWRFAPLPHARTVDVEIAFKRE